MAIVPVQTSPKVRGAGVSSQAFTLSGVTAGNALVISVNYGAASTNTAQATYPANWVVSSLKSPAGGGREDIAVLPGNFVTGGSVSVTLTFASGTYITGDIAEISGLDPASPLDLVLTATGSSVTSLTPTASNHTTSQASEILIGVAASDPYYASGTDTSTQPTGYTQLWQETNANSYATGVGAYKILSAITTVADTWSVPGGTYVYAIAVSLKAATSTSNTATGAATLSPTASGSALASNPIYGIATLIPAANGTATQSNTNSATGSATLSPTAQGTAQAKNSAIGSASVFPSASGTATQSSTPILFAHTIKVDASGSGTSPMTTPAITTPAISTILLQVLTQTTGTLQSVSDSYGNTWTQKGTTHTYSGSAETALFYCDNAAGGPNHTFSLIKTSGYQTDESTLFVQVFSGGSGLGAVTFDNTGTLTSANPLTTTQNNSAVASFWGSSDYTGGTNTYGVGAPWILLDQNGNSTNSNSGADSYTDVSASGTTVNPVYTAVNTPSSGASMWLVEVLAGSGGQNLATGSATIQPTATGSASALNRATGAATFAFAAAGTAFAIASAVGSASIHPTAQGSAQARNPATGEATLQPTAKGSAILSGTNSATGSATLQPSASGSAKAQGSAVGKATIQPTAQGQAQAFNPASGKTSVSPSAKGAALAFQPVTGLATVMPTAFGRLSATNSAFGAASLIPTAQGAVHPPFVGYPADPNFYILQPPRTFYAAMSSRSFYASLPSRIFYVLDQPTMPAQIFPGVMDPAETKVLTIDGTDSVPSGVTLVSIIGSPIISVTAGGDPNVATVFSGAVINTAPIAAEPPDIPVAIGANLGVQIIATKPADGASYEIRIPCQTSQSNNVVTLKAIVRCSQS